jgi:hypothetical protein
LARVDLGNHPSTRGFTYFSDTTPYPDRSCRHQVGKGSLATDTDLRADSLWLVDSTPVERARSRPTVKRSNLAGWAGDSSCRVLDLLPGGRVHPPDTITWST